MKLQQFAMHGGFQLHLCYPDDDIGVAYPDEESTYPPTHTPTRISLSGCLCRIKKEAAL